MLQPAYTDCVIHDIGSCSQIQFFYGSVLVGFHSFGAELNIGGDLFHRLAESHVSQHEFFLCGQLSLIDFMGRIPPQASPDKGLVRAMAGGRVVGLCRLEDGLLKSDRLL